MKFKDFQNLDYHPEDKMEFVLSDLLFRRQIDLSAVLVAYTDALEKERHIGYCKFEEACVNITQLIGKHFKKKDRLQAVKRAIHTFNFSKSLPRDIHNAEYGYTEVDRKQWDEFCELHYGRDFKDW